MREELLKINYVTNLSINERSGGWTGANVNLYEEMAARADVTYTGPVNPPSDLIAKIPSKIARTLHARGSFPFFSRRRLDRIARETRDKAPRTADCDFFFGSTPWVHTTPSRPYFTYTDCSFLTYMHAYHDLRRFVTADIDRIVDAEKKWMQASSGVFIATSWAADAVAEAYDLDDDKVKVVGMGGATTIPSADRYDGGRDLVFIAYDFEKKGGQICVDAYRLLKQSIPRLRLIVIGGKPDAAAIGDDPDIVCTGLLNKDNPADAAKYDAILEKAFLLIHPSMADIGSAAILEAAYRGCPALAPRRFCYTDQVVDGITGLLFEPPLNAAAFSEAIAALDSDLGRYQKMRADARRVSLERFTWAAVADEILNQIRERLHSSRSAAIET